MLISVRKRFVFIANSKVGSTSIQTILTPYAEINRAGTPQRKHAPWSEVQREYSFLFGNPEYASETFFKFGVIRESLDWVRSWFNYRRGNTRVEHPLPPDTDFADWWCNGNDWVRNLRQSRIFADGNVKCAMDLLVPFDELTEAWPNILRVLNLPHRDLPLNNKSPGKFKQSEITPEIAHEIRQHYRDDVELYELWKTQWRRTLS